MRGFHLAIDYAEIVSIEVGAQMGKRDFRGIADARKHRFSKKSAAKRDAVEATCKLAVDPCLDTVGVTQLVQLKISGLHVGVDPCAGLVVAGRVRASSDDFGKSAVEAHAITAVAQGPGQRTMQLQLVGKQHHAGVWAPPKDRFSR